jgi:DNA-binding PadR family transcriptional regulator
MSLEHILLGMLRRPASGYHLKAEFDAGARHFWSAELSQIYPTLQRMEERGWLTSRREPSPAGPERRVYRRTAAGKLALREWLRAGPAVGAERFAYLGQLINLGELADPAATAEFLTQLRDRLGGTARLLEGAEAELRGRPGGAAGLDDHAFHGLLCLRVGILSLRAKVEACDEGIALVRARLRKGGSRV